ncbi:MAG: cell division protein ZapE [Alphaproteobacteria bacterium]
MTVSLQQIYTARLASGELRPDPPQARAVDALQNLCVRLSAGVARQATGTFGRLWRQKQAVPAVRGIYLHGEVGRGKSMLMDLFFDAAPVKAKRRVHFHQFMLEIHAALHQWRGRNSGKADPLPQIARRIAADSKLLCFDEFHVCDIADAMILGRLFTALFQAGVVLVATSNWPPDELYKGGLQRQLFLPFIETLKSQTDIVELEGATDYRLARVHGRPMFFSPLGPEASRHLAELFAALTDDAEPKADTLQVAQGRHLELSRAAKGAAWCTFAELCEQPLGAADYLALANGYHVLLLDGVPCLNSEQRNAALRFMTLIDALYEAKVKLAMTSAAPPEQIYTEGEHSFAFKRTVSRLMEMQAADYLGAPHVRTAED